MDCSLVISRCDTWVESWKQVRYVLSHLWLIHVKGAHLICWKAWVDLLSLCQPELIVCGRRIEEAPESCSLYQLLLLPSGRAAVAPVYEGYILVIS